MALMDGTIGNSTGAVNGYLTGTLRQLDRSSYRCMLRGVIQRIDKRLAAVGLSASAASKAAGLSEDAIRNMRRAADNDDRKGVSTRTVSALAPVLRTTVGWLLEGAGPEESERRTVKLVGYVGAGAEAHYYAAADDPNEEVDAPDDATESTVAAEIRGQSLGPVFERWLLFYDEVRSPVTPDLYGQLCVVGLPDERVLVKQIKPAGSSGLFHLISNSGEPPLFDMEIDWAAKVKNMKPR